MNLHEPVCGPGRAWMQLTSCYLIGWGWLTSTNVYSGNGVLYYDSLWQTYLVRKRYISSPQIIAQNHAFKVKVIQTCLSVGCKHTSWKECKCTVLFLGQMHDGGCFCFLFLLLGVMKEKEFKSYRVQLKPGVARLGPDPAECMVHSTWAQSPSVKRRWIWHPASQKPGLSMPFKGFPSRAEGCSIQIYQMFGGAI